MDYEMATRFIERRVRVRPDGKNRNWRPGTLKRLDGRDHCYIAMGNGRDEVKRVALNHVRPWVGIEAATPVPAGARTIEELRALPRENDGGIPVTRLELKRAAIGNAVDAVVNGEKLARFEIVRRGGHVAPWRKIRLNEIDGFPTNALTALHAEMIYTLGDLSDASRQFKNLQAVRGIGPSTVDAVGDTLERFWTEHYAAEAEQNAVQEPATTPNADNPAAAADRNDLPATEIPSDVPNVPQIASPETATDAQSLPVGGGVTENVPPADALIPAAAGPVGDEPGVVTDSKRWMVVDLSTKQFYHRASGVFTNRLDLLDNTATYARSSDAHRAESHLAKLNGQRATSVVGMERVLDWLTSPDAPAPPAEPPDLFPTPTIPVDGPVNPMLAIGELVQRIESIDAERLKVQGEIDALSRHAHGLLSAREAAVKKLREFRGRIDALIGDAG